MNSKIIKKKKCSICNSNKIVLVTNRIREGKKSVLNCLNCKIVFLDKINQINYSAKKKIYSTNLTDEKIDYEKMLRIVKNFGYNGFIGVEYEGSRLSEIDGIKATRDLLIKIGQSI